jgi:hypothetical protein
MSALLDKIIITLKKYCILSLMVLLFLSASSRQSYADVFSSENDDISIGKAYLITGTGFTLPVISSLPLLMPEVAPDQARIAGITLFTAGAAWGTSLGFYYSGYTTYATVSGIIRTIMIGTSLTDSYFVTGRETSFNRLLLFIPLVWDLIELIALGILLDYKNNNRSYMPRFQMSFSFNL